MSTFFERTTRHVLPRWRPYQVAAKTGELRDRKPRDSVRGTSVEFAQKKAAWLAVGTIEDAAELVLASVIEQQEPSSDVRDAAELVYQMAPGPLREVAASVLDRQHDYYPIKATDITINRLRHRLRDDPRNAIAAVDLALAYTTIGLVDKAAKSLEYARKVAPDNRFVMRATARYWAHRRDPERAHAVFARSPKTATDPWLLAGEIGTADLATTAPKHLKAARRFISATGVAPSEITELAAAVASLELRNGDIRTARKLFRVALAAPNENAVAQAIWAAHAANAAEPTIEHLTMGRAFEAQAREAAHSGDWLAAVVASDDWFADQRFSVAAAAFGSYAASVGLGDYRRGLEFAELGLEANPHDHLMLNNVAFCAASLGDYVKAEVALGKVPASAFDSDGVLLATKGLVEFRKGNIDSGREFYNRSIEFFRSERLPKSVALACIFLAREELEAETDAASSVVESAIVTSAGRAEPEIVRWLNFLKSKLSDR
jgi:tetratricopeptide (TPR) repeat protein